jgi:hypothetical protein
MWRMQNPFTVPKSQPLPTLELILKRTTKANPLAENGIGHAPLDRPFRDLGLASGIGSRAAGGERLNQDVIAIGFVPRHENYLSGRQNTTKYDKRRIARR